MKKHINNAGVKHWYGDHLVDLQKEALDAIEAYAGNIGPAILSGCAITLHGGGPNYDIAAGIVVINHATDGFQIARFAGVSNVDLSAGGYLSITKTAVSGTYDSGSGTIAQNYTAGFTAGAAPTPGNPLYLEIPDPTTNAFPPDLFAAYNKAAILKTSVTNTSAEASGTFYLTLNRITRTLNIRGQFQILSLTGWGAFPIHNIQIIPWGTISADATLGKYVSPAVKKWFIGLNEVNAGTYSGVPPQVNMFYDGTGGIVAELQQTGALYNVNVDATIYLD